MHKNKIFASKTPIQKNLITCDGIDSTDNIKRNNIKHFQISKTLSKTARTL
jgi:hypothetical protein